MMLQRVIPLTFVTILISFILFANLPSFTCFDPAGCILLQPGETLSIGITRVSSGPGQKTSLEIQQSAELAIRQIATFKNVPNLSLQPFFAPCLPGSESGSSIEAASTNNLIVVFGPGCPSDEVDFKYRMARAAIMVFSPMALISLDSADSFDQSLINIAQQAVTIVASLQYQSVIVAASADENSTHFQDIFCQALRQEKILCHLNLEGDTFEQIHPEAQIFISLATELLLPFANVQLMPEVPTFLIALSRPQAIGDPSLDVPFWIGPASWAGSEFITNYLQTYRTVPESLESRITHDRLPYIIKSLLETSRLTQAGIWIVPRQAFGLSLVKNMEIFTMSTMHDCGGQPACILAPLSLFKLDGNEYKLAKP